MDHETATTLVMEAMIKLLADKWGDAMGEVKVLRAAISRHRQLTLQAVEEREASDADSELWDILDL